MKKNIFGISLLLMFLAFAQMAVAQTIIMGSTPLVGDIDEEVRNFYDPGGVPGAMGDNQDPNGYFAPNLKDTMTLRTNTYNCVLYVLFEEFAMTEGDSLWIFDGPNCSSPLIGVYNQVNSPGEFLSTGKNLTFVFHSDEVDIPGLMAGWQAKVYAYDTLPANRLFGDGYVYNLTCLSEFYDSGGPTGNIAANNENSSGTSYVEFTSPVGTHIKCEFSQFAVNGIMKIYDGMYMDPDKRLIGQFCTSTLDGTTNNRPPVLFSSGNTLSFVYVGAANDVNKAGWHATITCVATLFESPDGSACPSVTNIPSGVYADAPNPKDFDFDCSNPVVLLEAEVIATGRYTNDYTVKQIPYNEENMLFAYNEGDPIGASSDDNWLSGVSLPFTFIFFGRPYTMVYPGTNGLISMNPQSGGCTYSYQQPPTTPPYSSIPYVYKNCVYGVYEDIDCRYYTNKQDGLGQGNVRVKVLGQYPCRAFVFNYLNVGLYGLTNTSTGSQYQNYNTYQMVLYEGTNIIDVYVKHRKCCATTNSHGEGIIGLQNNTSSQILLAPERGMTSWNTDNEAWRFTPITPFDENGELTWYANSVSPANIISYDAHAKNRKITVSPTETTKYISEYKYHNANNDEFIIRDTTTIRVRIPSVLASSNTGTNHVCPNDNATLSVSFQNYPDVQPMSYRWSSGDTTATCVVSPSQTQTYRVTVTFDNGCTNYDSVAVLVTDLEFPTITGIDTICFGKSTTLTASHPTSNQFHWSSGQTTSTITVSPQVTTTYIVSATMIGDCIVTDTLTVTVLQLPKPQFQATPTEIYVENGIGTVNCVNLTPGDNHLVWNFGDVFSNLNIIEDVEDPAHDYTHSGYYTITLTATDSLGCVDSVKNRVSVEVPYFFYIPNSFTPDGDGVNEYFAPQGHGVDPENYLMQIFDRSGMLIYTTHNPYDYWDGRNKYGQKCPEGVYVYRILLRNLNVEDKEYTGTVTLIR